MSFSVQVVGMYKNNWWDRINTSTVLENLSRKQNKLRFDSSRAFWLEAEKQDKNILNFTGEGM